MSPAEASALQFEEPNWRERFEEHCARWPRLPRYLQEDSAYTNVLMEWRRFHQNDMAFMPSSFDAQLALAKLGLYAPRFIHKDVPRSQDAGFQSDEMMWLSIAGEQWRIVAIEDRIMILEKGFEDKPEQHQIDLGRMKWDKYVQSATAMLEAGFRLLGQ